MRKNMPENTNFTLSLCLINQFLLSLYVLETINNGATVKVNKKFKSRSKAIDYAFTYFERKTFNNDLQIEDEYEIEGNKHNIEYVLDYYTRFRVERVQLAA